MEPASRPPERCRARRPRSAAPALLPTFFLATAVIVLAVVALDRIRSDLADAGAIVLVVVAAGCLAAAIRGMLGEQTQPEDDGPEPGDGPGQG